MTEPRPKSPAPVGLSPLNEPVATAALPQLYLEFEATQSEPALEKIFLAKGGSIAAAAARGTSDFALSGAVHATPTKLSDRFATVVRIPVPPESVSANEERPLTVNVDNRAKLLVSGSRAGASINGTLVSTVAGQGAAYLSKLFRSATGHVTIPLTYASWAAHTAVVAASHLRVVDDDGRRYNIHFVENPERDAALKHAEQIVGQWANGAWTMRQEGLKYPHSPTLTKAIANVPCGINDSGYDLVHNVVEQRLPYSYDTINSMLKNAMQTDLEFIPEDISQFLVDTAEPGKQAAGWGRTLAASLSMLASLLVSYRADGRTSIMPDGSQAVAAESWLRQAPRGPDEGNDCDGSAILAASLARTVAQTPSEVARDYEYLNAARNIIVPHYTIGVSVLGASSAEASSGGEGASKEQTVAGHAATIMIDTIGLLTALEKGSHATVGTAPVVAADKREVVAAKRFAACFSPEVLATLPEVERAELKDWETAKATAAAMGLQSYGIEGTTPASPVLYATGKEAERATKTAENDSKAFEKAAPNVGRSIKILYTGGHDPQSPHKFYHDFVEFNLGRSHPLWMDPAVRELGCAATQIVLAKQPNRSSGLIPAAGATPRELATGTYSAVPLVVTDTQTATLIDYASEQADVDVMAPRVPSAKLDAFQSKQLSDSLDALSALDDALKGNETSAGHTVAYMLAYSTLVNNPKGVEHLCSRLKAVAACGMVDSLDVVGLAVDVDGNQAGKMVVINARIP